MSLQNTQLRKRGSTCLIKSNVTIKHLLARRFKELGFSYTDIINYAEVDGFSIDKSILSEYFTKKDKHRLSQELILYLCARYGVRIEIDVRIKPYNEDVSKKDLALFKEFLKDK